MSDAPDRDALVAAAQAAIHRARWLAPGYIPTDAALAAAAVNAVLAAQQQATEEPPVLPESMESVAERVRAHARRAPGR